MDLRPQKHTADLSPEDFLLQFQALSEAPPPLSPRRFLAGVLILLAALSTCAAVLVSTCTVCYAVSDHGRPLAYIQGQETYQAAVQQVEAQVSAILQSDYSYPDAADVALTIAPKEKLQTPDQLTASLMETVDQVQPAYVLSIDGVSVGACVSREAIDQALAQVKARYETPSTVASYFVNTLNLELTYLPVQEPLLDADDLLALLLPDLTQDDALPVFADSAPPLLEVCTVEEITSLVPIPAPTEDREDPTLLVGEETLLQEGTPGLEARTERVFRRRGLEESRELISSCVLTEAVPSLRAVGVGQGTQGAVGRFLWPCEGKISSPFGARSIFGSNGFHSGTDIAAPSGTDIHAAAAGTVIWTGAKGSYGNLVKVDHGNGYVTYYAHCSRILVQEGDAVTQGQTIALVGSTGRSTGPHCHFEIHWQEEALDPQACFS